MGFLIFGLSFVAPTLIANEATVILKKPTLSSSLNLDSTLVWKVTLAELNQQSDYIFVDRETLQQTLDELSLSELQSDSQRSSKLGEILGADYIVNARSSSEGEDMLTTVQVTEVRTSKTTADYKSAPAGDVVSVSKSIAAVILKALDTAKPGITVSKADSFVLELPENGKRPVVGVWIDEYHVSQPLADPAAEIQLTKRLIDSGFTVVDMRPHQAKENTAGGFKKLIGLAKRHKAEVLIYGEGISELADRIGSFEGTRARVEIKAVDLESGKILISESKYGIATDLAESIAAKKSLQEAADLLALDIIPKLIQPE